MKRTRRAKTAAQAQRLRLLTCNKKKVNDLGSIKQQHRNSTGVSTQNTIPLQVCRLFVDVFVGRFWLIGRLVLFGSILGFRCVSIMLLESLFLNTL